MYQGPGFTTEEFITTEEPLWVECSHQSFLNAPGDNNIQPMWRSTVLGSEYSKKKLRKKFQTPRQLTSL